MRRRTTQRTMLVSAVILCPIVIAILISCFKQPEDCVLCGSGTRERHHAPVILNLATGQKNEMRVYDPDLPRSDLEIAQIQTTGTFSFASCAGLTGRRDTCSHTCTVNVPFDTARMKKAHFCTACRELLEPHKDQGYVLVDMYNENEINVYGIFEAAEYEIRDYKVTVSEQVDQAEFEVEILGQIEGLVFID